VRLIAEVGPIFKPLTLNPRRHSEHLQKLFITR
jgi:hypothetical protein